MAAYPLDTLLRLWALQQLTTEQAIGQLLQILRDLEPRVKYLEQALVRVNALLPVTPTAPSPSSTTTEVAHPRKRRSKRRGSKETQ